MVVMPRIASKTLPTGGRINWMVGRLAVGARPKQIYSSRESLAYHRSERTRKDGRTYIYVVVDIGHAQSDL